MGDILDIAAEKLCQYLCQMGVLLRNTQQDRLLLDATTLSLDIVKGHNLSEGHRIPVDHVKHSVKKVGESPAEKNL